MFDLNRIASLGVFGRSLLAFGAGVATLNSYSALPMESEGGRSFVDWTQFSLSGDLMGHVETVIDPASNFASWSLCSLVLNPGFCTQVYGFQQLPAVDAGSVFPARIDLSNLTPLEGLRLEGAAAGDRTGEKIKRAGDINGDGLADLILGAAFSSPQGLSQAGSAYVVWGSETLVETAILNLGSLSAPKGLVIEGASAGDHTAFSIAGAGDVNGDGFDDLLIGAYDAVPPHQKKRSNAGRSYLLWGESLREKSKLSLRSIGSADGLFIEGAYDMDGTNSGYSVSSAGDVDGDGFSDLLIGAPYADPQMRVAAGSAYIVWGGSELEEFSSIDLGQLGVRGLVIEGASSNDFAGYFTNAAGDIDGDGFDDILIGAYAAHSEAGITYLLWGSKSLRDLNRIDLNTLDASQGVSIKGAVSSDRSGISLSGAGDVDGDGFCDVLIGAYKARSTGNAYLIWGSRLKGFSSLDLASAGPSDVLVIQGISSNDAFGYSVSSAGDLNGDGFSDVLLGAYGVDPYGRSAAGTAYVVWGGISLRGLGSIDLLSAVSSTVLVINGAVAGDSTGISVTDLGDVNGDNVDDILIGASMASPRNLGNAGVSYIIYGQLPLNLKVGELTILEGETVSVSGDDLKAVASMSMPSDLSFSVFAATHGHFSLLQSPRDPVVTFTQSDVNAGSILFVHDGSNEAPSIEVLLRNTRGETYTGSLVVNFTMENDAPVLLHNELNVAEGQTVMLTTEQLQAADEESTEADIILSVSEVEHGVFTFQAEPGISVVTFTQKDVSDGRIQFIHDGTDSPPSYRVQATDGELTTNWEAASITYISLNGRPVMQVNKITLRDAGKVFLSSNNLLGYDREASTDDTQLLITDLEHGKFSYVLNQEVALSSFSQAQVNAGQLVFVHDGTQIPPGYNVTVSDGAKHSFPLSADVSFNVRPVLLDSSFRMTQGGVHVITAANLQAMDVETESSRLEIIVSSVQHGQFERLVDLDIPIVRFFQSEIEHGDVLFVHDGGWEAPRFKVQVDDGWMAGELPPARWMQIDFHQVLLKNEITINQGEILTLSDRELKAIHPNLGPAQLEFHVSNVRQGHFEHADEPGYPISEFTQADIDAGKITFEHQGGELAPSYDVSVHYDSGKSQTEIQTSVVRFNFLPIIEANALTLNQGQTVLVTRDILSATDKDGRSEDLIFQISEMQHGRFELKGNAGTAITEFSQSQVRMGKMQFVHDGTPSEPSYKVVVKDTHGGMSPLSVPNIKFTEEETLSDQLKSEALATIIAIPGALLTGIIGVGFFKYKVNKSHSDFRKHNNPLADKVREKLGLSNIDNFQTGVGLAYSEGISRIRQGLELRGVDVNFDTIDLVAECLAQGIMKVVKDFQPTLFGMTDLPWFGDVCCQTESGCSFVRGRALKPGALSQEGGYLGEIIDATVAIFLAETGETYSAQDDQNFGGSSWDTNNTGETDSLLSSGSAGVGNPIEMRVQTTPLGDNALRMEALANFRKCLGGVDGNEFEIEIHDRDLVIHPADHSTLSDPVGVLQKMAESLKNNLGSSVVLGSRLSDDELTMQVATSRRAGQVRDFLQEAGVGSDQQMMLVSSM